jgi:hypothetical protein
MQPIGASQIQNYPTLVSSRQTHTNGAATSVIELRKGPAGWLTILRTDDVVDKTREWHHPAAFGANEAAARADFGSRGGR